MAAPRIAIEYHKGEVDLAQLVETVTKVKAGLSVLTPKGPDKALPDFEGKAMASLQLDVCELQRMLMQYVVKIVAVDNGISTGRFKTGDIIMTLDKGARDASGKIIDFSPDGSVAIFQKGNGSTGQVSSDYMKLF